MRWTWSKYPKVVEDGGNKGEARRKKEEAGRINGTCSRLVANQLPTTGCRLVNNQGSGALGPLATSSRHRPQASPTAISSFQFFWYILIFLILEFWGTSWHMGRMSAQYIYFFKLPPTFGSIKSSILHRIWRFHFFPNFLFAKSRVHMDLHIHCWDFVLWKIEITKNSSRIASVMEIF